MTPVERLAEAMQWLGRAARFLLDQLRQIIRRFAYWLRNLPQPYRWIVGLSLRPVPVLPRHRRWRS